ncbi:hypothetical protein SAMN05444157_3482 [Frankineae bacterium MT45]|nr:hypothetical protein SAMN05444157_3482 [Frankineae bacterium MT45]
MPLRRRLLAGCAVLAALPFCIGITAAGAVQRTVTQDAATPKTAAVKTAAVKTAAPSAAGGVLVVSPSGLDSAAGTVAHPLRSISAAVHRLAASGGVIELRGGRYHERVAFTGLHDLALIPYENEHPILDGSTLTPPAGDSALISVVNSHRITVRGLEITGYRTRSLNHTPIGIYLHGFDTDVQLIANHVHDLGNYNTTLGSFDINAHGIAAYGDDPLRPISGLSISNNTVDHLKLGASESVVVNGNVDGWAIVGNDIHDNNNIGIDAIGYETTLTGKYRYTDTNRARHGIIAQNRVTRIISRGNPAYYEDGSYCDCADGIYVDGATAVAITANTVTYNDIGIEVAAENAKGSADHVAVSGNSISYSGYVGIATGGYCDGGADCGDVKTGQAHDNSFTGNTLRFNNQFRDGSPEILVQYHVRATTFAGNHLTTDQSALYGTVPRISADPLSGNNRSDYNTFTLTKANTSEATFGWLGNTYTGLSQFRSATGQDEHSQLIATHH